MTAHNFRQKRDRIMREIREAHTAMVWNMQGLTPYTKRARTLACRRLTEKSRALWKLFAGI